MDDRSQVLLEFVGTLRRVDTSPIDLLPTPAELRSWLIERGVLTSRCRAANEADLARARKLRTVARRLLVQASSSQPLTRSDVAVLNEFAAAPTMQPSLRADGQVARSGDVPAGLATLAQVAVELIGGTDLPLVKWCEGDGCTRPFVDRSRGSRRRWCDMAGCGDRAKARSYRSRRRDAMP